MPLPPQMSYTNIARVTFDYLSRIFTFPGNNVFLYGGSSKIRTYDRHRMKMLHYHFAILPIFELYMTTDLLSSLVPYNRIELLPTDYETVVLPLN